jgi:tetratricopeptide (TPR) repeat protein
MTHSIQNVRPGLILGIVLAAATVAMYAPSARAADKKGPEISRVIAKEMIAAQKAEQAGQWQEALKNLDAAQQKSPLTAYDEKTIFYMKGFAEIKLGNAKAAQADFEKSLATGAASPEDTAQMKRTLFSIAASTQQYQKTIDYGKEMADEGSLKPDELGVIAQSYYLLKDCKNAGVWSDKAIAAARRAGEIPKENYFLFKLQCASDANDYTAMDAVLIDLIKVTNKTTYWNTLLRIERQDERDDHNLLMIYRIMYDTNSMDKGSDYMEMAQLLGDAALPGEAQAVLEKGVAAGLFKDQKDVDRANRLLASLKPRAEADKKGEAQEDAEATKSPAGELDVKMGEVYFGSGDYGNAVTAINRGLQKGQIKHPDEGYVYLGRANVQLKNFADAKKAFAGLKSVPNISPRVLKLWDLYSDKLG